MVGLTLLTLQGCESPNVTVFDSPVALSDETLPDYTEYGYNTAGASITATGSSSSSQHLWRILYPSPPSAHITKVDYNTFTFSMSGVNLPAAEIVELSFTFQADIGDTLTGLRTLGNTQHSTQQNNLTANISGNQASFQGLHITSASLSFNRSRSISATPDARLYGVSLSGTFEISGETLDGVNVKISSGRFDILFIKYNGTSFSNGIK